jgi:iron(III) transport system permease protein
MQADATTARRSRLQWTLIAFCLVFMLALLIWPLVLVVTGGLQPDESGGRLHHLLGVLADPIIRHSLLNSTLIAALVTLLSLLIATPLAVVSTKYEFRGKAILSGLLLLPLILPPFVGAIGLRQLLGRYGGINSLFASMGIIDASDPVDFLGGARFWGVVLMEALHLYPIVFLNASAALANLDPAMEQAADNLGASRWTRFRKITWPLILPGVFAGGTIVFIWSFTELGTPLMFDFYDVAPVKIFWGLQEIDASPRPYALVIIVLAMAVSFYAAGRWAFGGRAYAMTTRAMTASSSRRLGLGAGLLAAAPFMLIISLASLPHLGVVLTSLTAPGQWYRGALPSVFTTGHFSGALSHKLAGGSIRNSLVYSSLAMIVDLVLGCTLAYLIVRGRSRITRLLDGLAMLPLAVPGLVLAFGYYAMSLHWPFPQLGAYFAGLGWDNAAARMQVSGPMADPMMFLVIAYAVRRLPYVVRSAVAGLEQTSGDLEDAALNLGASRPYTVRRVVLPLIAANLIAGGLLAFSFAMLEVSDSLILAQSEKHYPLTKAIYTLFRRLGDGPYIASALGAWGMALMAVTLIGVSLLLGRKLGSLFRI